MLIKKPIYTEKSVKLNTDKIHRYTFEVDKDANKTDIKLAIKSVYGVVPVKIQTIMIPGKQYRKGKRWIFGKKPDRKKAIITLKPGQNIERLEVTGTKE
jgi:large subunit ribosomal protein L23